MILKNRFILSFWLVFSAIVSACSGGGITGTDDVSTSKTPVNNGGATGPTVYQSVTPTKVDMLEDATFLISGANIPNATYLSTLADSPCQTTYASTSRIISLCTAPSTSGTVNLVLKDANDKELKSFAVVVSNAVYSSITPLEVGMKENITFTITGTNIPNAQFSADIGGLTCSVSWSSSTELSANCVTPITSGSATFTLKDAASRAILQTFTVTVSAPTFSTSAPTSVPTRVIRGRTVTYTLSGSRFPDINYAAWLGTSDNTCTVNRLSANSMTVTCTAPTTGSATPTLTINTGSVGATAAGTTLYSSAVPTIYDAPTITSVSPNRLAPFSTLTLFTLTGANLIANSTTYTTALVCGTNSLDCTVSTSTPVTATTITTSCSFSMQDASSCNLVTKDGTIEIGRPAITFTSANSGGTGESITTTTYSTALPSSSVSELTFDGNRLSSTDTNYNAVVTGPNGSSSSNCTNVSTNGTTTTLKATCTMPAIGPATISIYHGPITNSANLIGTVTVTLNTNPTVVSVSPVSALPGQAWVRFTVKGNNFSSNSFSATLIVGTTSDSTNNCRNINIVDNQTLVFECNTPSAGGDAVLRVYNDPAYNSSKLVNNTLKVYLSPITKITVSPKIFTVYSVAAYRPTRPTTDPATTVPADSPPFTADKLTITVEAVSGLDSSTKNSIVRDSRCTNWAETNASVTANSGTSRTYTCTPTTRPVDAKHPDFYTFADGTVGVSDKAAVTVDDLGTYTKVDYNGNALADQTKAYNSSSGNTLEVDEAAGVRWSCVRDNRRNVYWTINSPSGYYGKDKFANPDALLLEVHDINRQATPLCGKRVPMTADTYSQTNYASDLAGDAYRWRIPTQTEMVDYLIFRGNAAPAISAVAREYFPTLNSDAGGYWTFGSIAVIKPNKTYGSQTVTVYNADGTTATDPSTRTVNDSIRYDLCAVSFMGGDISPPYKSETLSGNPLTVSDGGIPLVYARSWCGVSTSASTPAGTTVIGATRHIIYIRNGE